MLRHAAQEVGTGSSSACTAAASPAQPKAPAKFVTSHELQISSPAVMLAEHLRVVQHISGPSTRALILKGTAESKDQLKEG